MTYPDRQPIRDDRRLWLVLILLFLALYIPFAAEAAMKQEVCISAMTQTLGQAPVTVPVVCE